MIYIPFGVAHRSFLIHVAMTTISMTLLSIFAVKICSLPPFSSLESPSEKITHRPDE